MELKEHVFITYLNLRRGIVMLTIMLPLLLIGIGYAQKINLQKSLSSYYHACPEGYEVPSKVKDLAETHPEDEQLQEIVNVYSYAYYHNLPKGHLLRTIFVSILIALGIFLFLYKGYSDRENNALNLAGVFAILVALFPMAWSNEAGEVIFKAGKFGMFSVHGFSAVLLVFCVAYVCIFRPSKTLDLITNENVKKSFRREYNFLGGLMIILPIFIFVYLNVLGRNDNLILWVEIAVLLVFARYWWKKSNEVAIINAQENPETPIQNFISK